jgi:hypothetical protein
VIFFLKKTKKYFFYKFGKAWIRIRIEILGWIRIKECGSETLIIILFIFMQPQRREYRCSVQRSHQAAAACRRSQYPLHRHRWQVNFKDLYFSSSTGNIQRVLVSVVDPHPQGSETFGPDNIY